MRTLPYFLHEGFRIAYEQLGRRPGAARRPTVLIHGLLFSRRHHLYLAEALAARGNRVVLVDLLGHGESDKPAHARHYTMELFGGQVLGLLDHLELDQAVIAGTSLGANVSLEVAVQAPTRVRGLVLEMPVLERAAPAAALIFVPLTILYAEAAPLVGTFARIVRALPTPPGLYPQVFQELLGRDPQPSAAVLHGLLTGRIAPHTTDRQKIDAPTLVIAHRRDILHPFSDAEALHRELPGSELVRARSFFELRFAPNRLSDRIADFLDEVWS